MRGISLTALAISNLAYWAFLALAVAIVTIAAFIVALFADVDALPRTLEALKSSDDFSLLTSVLARAAAALGGGFVAGRLNRERPVLQSALALGSSTLLYVFDLGHGPQLNDDADLDVPAVSTFATARVFIGLLLGMLGGHLAERHNARLDAMSPQQRCARTWTASAVAALRWTLAFPAATAAFSLAVVLAPGLPSVLRSLVFVFAVIMAILAGTLVAPPAQRRFAGFLFIALTLLIPFEEIARHTWFGGLTDTHAVLIVGNTAAAGFAYVGLRHAFPGAFATDPGRWWWILDLDLLRWSPDERTARRGLAVTFVVIWFALLLFMWGLLNGQGLDLVFALASAAVVTLPVALMAARPAFVRIAPDLLSRADHNAVARHETRRATPAE